MKHINIIEISGPSLKDMTIQSHSFRIEILGICHFPEVICFIYRAIIYSFYCYNIPSCVPYMNRYLNIDDRQIVPGNTVFFTLLIRHKFL